jgi:PTS system mannose-specific IIB component
VCALGPVAALGMLENPKEQEEPVTLRLVRVDDRLIHGQVVAIWLKAIGAKRIVILDDRTARDEFLKEVITYAAPRDVPVEVLEVEPGIERVRHLAAEPEPIFVLMRSPRVAVHLREAGVEFPVLNVGGMGAGPGRKPLYRNISAAPEEMEAMRKLETMGTKVELRITENERSVAFTSVDK